MIANYPFKVTLALPSTSGIGAIPSIRKELEKIGQNPMLMPISRVVSLVSNRPMLLSCC